MFAGQARAYPSEALYGRLMALSTNIKLSLKNLPGINTLAYIENS
jgi:hypothetical protein